MKQEYKINIIHLYYQNQYQYSMYTVDTSEESILILRTLVYSTCIFSGMKFMLGPNFQTGMIIYLLYMYIIIYNKVEQNHTGVNKIRNQTKFIQQNIQYNYYNTWTSNNYRLTPSVYKYRCREEFMNMIINMISCTSNIGSPVSLDRAPNSIIIVPAHAVQVSDSLPVPDAGWSIPYFKLIWNNQQMNDHYVFYINCIYNNIEGVSE